MLRPLLFGMQGVKRRTVPLMMLRCALLLLVLAAPVALRGQDFNYTTNNGEITIVGYSGNIVGPVTIPDTIDGFPVRAIGNNAFANNGYPTSVTIPNSVVTIGSSAFHACSSLTSVVIPNSITNLG